MTERAPVYAHFIIGMGAPLHGCVGCIDGTTIRVARPGGGLQRACYSGHKRCHAIKFQSICAPDGLLFHLYGPVEGLRHDVFLYQESGLRWVRSTSLARCCGNSAVASTETRRPRTMTLLLPRLTATYRNNKTMP